jgi:D-glycero-D-manno-heptose 1,7-bisphosphate phosphatase
VSASIRHVILDRDGVLNEEPDDGAYVTDPANFRWLPGALAALAALRKLDVRISVVTNQSGIGRGRMTEFELAAVHDKMNTDARRMRGSIDAIFYCPHAPDAGCSCRKPAPALIEAAIDRSGIPRVNTLVIGDAARDLDAARAAGVRAALLRTGKGRAHEALAAARGIQVFEDLGALAAAIGAGENST